LGRRVLLEQQDSELKAQLEQQAKEPLEQRALLETMELPEQPELLEILEQRDCKEFKAFKD